MPGADIPGQQLPLTADDLAPGFVRMFPSSLRVLNLVNEAQRLVLDGHRQGWAERVREETPSLQMIGLDQGGNNWDERWFRYEIHHARFEEQGVGRVPYGSSFEALIRMGGQS